MKRIYILLTTAALLSGCVGMNYSDGDSTKQWLKVVSSKKDMDGNVTDVCYRLDLKFNPAEAITRLDTDMSCITKCCWYSERKSVELNFNSAFPDEIVKNGIAKKYSPENVNFYISYSPFLDTIHGRVSQKSAINREGLVTLEYTEVKDTERYLKIGHDDLRAAKFEDDAREGSYLFKSEEEKQAAKEAQAVRPITAAPAPATIAAREQAPKVQDTVSTDEREALLQQKLKYERNQAVLLVKRFYDQKIDAYIMDIDKAQKRKGLVLMANDRNWLTIKTGSPIYKVTCRVNGRLGATPQDMKDYPISCGVYEVNLDEQTVMPKDTDARTIVSGEYKN